MTLTGKTQQTSGTAFYFSHSSHAMHRERERGECVHMFISLSLCLSTPPPHPHNPNEKNRQALFCLLFSISTKPMLEEREHFLVQPLGSMPVQKVEEPAWWRKSQGEGPRQSMDKLKGLVRTKTPELYPICLTKTKQKPFF